MMESHGILHHNDSRSMCLVNAFPKANLAAVTIDELTKLQQQSTMPEGIKRESPLRPRLRGLAQVIIAHHVGVELSGTKWNVLRLNALKVSGTTLHNVLLSEVRTK